MEWQRERLVVMIVEYCCHRIWRFDGLVFGFDGWIVSRVGADSEVQLESKSTCDAELGTRIDSFLV